MTQMARVLTAHVEITLTDGSTWKVDLADHDRVRLEASIDWNQEPEELSLAETGYSSFRQFRPGPDKVITVRVAGRGEMVREKP